MNEQATSQTNTEVDDLSWASLPELKQVLVPIAQDAAVSIAIQMQTFDEMLWEIDGLLNDLQPPQSGRIRLYQQPTDQFQRYVPIVWRRSKVDNKWKFDKVGWAGLSRRAKQAREFYDNREMVNDLLLLAMAVYKARANLLLALTNFTKACTTRLSGAAPKGTKMRAQLKGLTELRNSGKYRTFQTGHAPAREDF